MSAASRGHGGVLFLRGSAHVGKTLLGRAIAAEGAASGMRILIGSAPPIAGGDRLAAICEAVSSAFRGPDAAPRALLEPFASVLQGVLLETTERQVEESEPPSDSLVFEALVRLLEALGAEHGALCLIEDLHEADPSTLAAVDYLTRNLARTRVLCIATLRDVAGPASKLTARAVEAGVASELVVGPLPDEEIDAIVTAALPAAPPADFLEEVRAFADGIPGAALELVRRAATAATLDINDGIRAAVRERLAGLDPVARRVVDAAAVLGEIPDLDLLSEVASVSEDDVQRALRQPVVARFLAFDPAPAVTIRFRHRSVRQAIIDGLLPPDRVELARRARSLWAGEVDLSHAARGELELLAGDGEPAARQFLAGADEALAAGDVHTAQDLVDRTTGLVAADGELGIRLLDLSAQLAATTGVAKWEREALRLLADLGDRMPLDGTATTAHLGLARAALARRDDAAAELHLDVARRLATADDVVLAAQIELADAERAHLRGETVFTDLDRTIATLEEHGDAAALCEGLRVMAIVSRDERFDDAVQLLHRMQETAERERLRLPRAVAKLLLGLWHAHATGDLSRLVLARDLVAEIGALGLAAEADVAIGALSLVAGNEEPALLHLERAVALAAEHELPALPLALAWMAAAHAAADRTAEMERVAADASDAGVGRADVAAVLDAEVMARSHLLHGSRAEALEALDRGLSRHRDPLVVISGRGMQALLHAGEGTPFVARDSDRHQWTRLDRGYAHVASAITQGRVGRTAEADEALDAGLAYLDIAPWGQNVALTVVADAAIADGWGDPASWLRRALAFFEDHDQRDLVTATRRLLGDSGAPVPRRRGVALAPAPLRALGVTSREYEVLELLAQGLTNAEIAKRLYLSPHTVKTHVASLFQKAGVTDRTALAAILLEHDEGAQIRAV